MHVGGLQAVYQPHMDTKHTVWTNAYDKFVALEASFDYKLLSF